VIIKGNFVLNSGVKKTAVKIDRRSGTIKKINCLRKPDITYPDTCLIFPGFIDLHVHAREDQSREHLYKEDFRTCSLAAVNGCVSALGEMPNNPLPPVDALSYKQKKKLARKSLVPVLLYGAVGPGTRPFSKTIPYKVFMGPSVGPLYYRNDNRLIAALKDYRSCYLSIHAEADAVLKKNKNKTKHYQKRPPQAEIKAVTTALALIKKYPRLHLKFCHVSTPEAAELIYQYKKNYSLTTEVTPHHLFFNTRDNKNKLLNVNPPLRSESKRKKLLNLFKKNYFDFLVTDHAPHTLTEKKKGKPGLPLLDTYGLFVTWLLKQNTSPQTILNCCCRNPGRFLQKFDKVRRGEIRTGYRADLAVLDLHTPHTFKQKEIKSKCGWSPFQGFTFPGSVKAFYLKGKKLQL